MKESRTALAMTRCFWFLSVMIPRIFIWDRIIACESNQEKPSGFGPVENFSSEMYYLWA
jgi:hypothetical protein